MEKEQKMNIFLASSIDEFAALRDRITSAVYGLNWTPQLKKVKFEVWRCEYLDDALSQERKQDYLNQFARNCDLFILIAGQDIGKGTLEEFETAFKDAVDDYIKFRQSLSEQSKAG